MLYEGTAHPKDLPILVAVIHAEARWLVTFNTKYSPAAGSRYREARARR